MAQKIRIRRQDGARTHSDADLPEPVKGTGLVKGLMVTLKHMLTPSVTT